MRRAIALTEFFNEIRLKAKKVKGSLAPFLDADIKHSSRVKRLFLWFF